LSRKIYRVVTCTVVVEFLSLSSSLRESHIRKFHKIQGQHSTTRLSSTKQETKSSGCVHFVSDTNVIERPPQHGDNTQGGATHKF